MKTEDIDAVSEVFSAKPFLEIVGIIDEKRSVGEREDLVRPSGISDL